ncbi:hypothetical protein ABZW49_00660 [Nonomuraea wenchangensis]
MLVASSVAALAGLLGVALGSASSYFIAREQFNQQTATKTREEKATACTTILASTWKVYSDLQMVSVSVRPGLANDKQTLKVYGDALEKAMKSTLSLGDSAPPVLLYGSKEVGDTLQRFGQEALEVVRHVPLESLIVAGSISVSDEKKFQSEMDKLRNTYTRLLALCRQEIGTT